MYCDVLGNIEDHFVMNLTPLHYTYALYGIYILYEFIFEH